jgi:hypothetical protein
MISLDEKLRDDIRIYPERDRLLIVLPRHLEQLKLLWQEARVLAGTLQQASEHIEVKNKAEPVKHEFVKLAFRCGLRKGDDKHVYLWFDYTDRLTLSYEASRVCALTLLKYAQDKELLVQGTRISYAAEGRLGRPTPIWLWFRKTFGRK